MTKDDYRWWYLRHTVPYLYEREPDAIRPDLRNLYEDHLEVLAENMMDDPDPDPED